MAASVTFRQLGTAHQAACSRLKASPCLVLPSTSASHRADVHAICRPACSTRCNGWVAAAQPTQAASCAPAGLGTRSTRLPAVAEAEGSTTSMSDAESSQESRDFAVALAEVCDSVKVQDLVVLHVEPLVSWTSYMVICTVISRPQLLAVLARVEKAAEEEHGRSKQNVPGSSPWEVVDFGDVVLHVFTAEQREFYDIESFYAAAEEVDLPFLEEQQDSSLGGQQPRPGQWSMQL